MKVCHLLKIKDQDIGLSMYYRDALVWIPEARWGFAATPPCPNCKTNANVVTHGFSDKHYARVVVDLTNTYNAMTRRYKCTFCKQKHKELKGRLQ